MTDLHQTRGWGVLPTAECSGPVDWITISKELASLQAEAEKDGPAPAASDQGSTADRIAADTKAIQDRAKRLTKIEKNLQRQLFEATHEGAARIRAEYAKMVEEMQELAAPDGSDRGRIDQLVVQAAALRAARLAEVRAARGRRRAEAR